MSVTHTDTQVLAFLQFCNTVLALKSKLENLKNAIDELYAFTPSLEDMKKDLTNSTLAKLHPDSMMLQYIDEYLTKTEITYTKLYEAMERVLESRNL